MTSCSPLLSQNFIWNLYCNKHNQYPQPILQIIDFEVSELDSKQIILRLSDGVTFIDCTLIGPYLAQEHKIVMHSSLFFNGAKAYEFKKFDLIKVTDYFSKIDQHKICKLKIMIRKIMEHTQQNKKINKPQQISYYYDITSTKSDQSANHQMNEEHTDIFKKHAKEDQVKIEILDSDQDNNADARKIYKQIEDEANQPVPKRMASESMMNSKQFSSYHGKALRNPDDPLTYKDIMDGHEGFFIGRLLRIKHGLKETKDGQMNLLYVGFLDFNGEMLRMNLVGKVAIKEEKLLRKGKCYYIKGLEVVQMKNSGSFIKLKEKDYKLHQVSNVEITKKISTEYFHWEHQFQFIQHQNVDVIGVIEDIEAKTFYGQKHANEVIANNKEMKEVIRVVIRNKFKTVKVSFWADQLKNLQLLSLKKKELIIIEDVKKKKSFFLDFGLESNVIRFHENAQLFDRYEHFLAVEQQFPQPLNIGQIYSIHKIDKYNSKIYTINIFLSRIQEEKVIFKICDLCKKKINIHSVKCFECNNTVCSFRYNTNAQFNDYTAAIWLSIFDNMAEKVFGINANQYHDLDPTAKQSLLSAIYYKNYKAGIEIKHDRFILRTVEENHDPKDFRKMLRNNLLQISTLLHPADRMQEE